MVKMSRDDAILKAAHVCKQQARQLIQSKYEVDREEARYLALVYDVLLLGTKQANKVEQINETRSFLVQGKF